MTEEILNRGRSGKRTQLFQVSIILSLGIYSILSVDAAPLTGPSGENAQGIFATYFQNMVNNPCTGNSITIGFKTSGVDYAKPDCISIGSRLASFFGGYGLAPSGQAVVGFDSITGEPKFGTVGGGGDTPIGSVIAFNLSSCPAGWVAADGSNGTVDLRGEFIRGWDNGRGVDTSRILASTQTDMFRSHTHLQSPNTEILWAAGTLFDMNGDGTLGSGIGGTTQATGGSETRPRNVALLYCTKISESSSSMSDLTTWTRTGNDVVQASPGNIGIGTNTPGVKLDVIGDVRISNLLTVSGNQNNAGTLTASSTIRANGGLISANAGGTYSYITMLDDESPNGVKYVHANSNLIGFVNGQGIWSAYWDNSGNQTNIGNMTTNGYLQGGIMYDTDSSYYVDANNSSYMQNLNVNDIYIRSAGKYASQIGRGSGTRFISSNYDYTLRYYTCPSGSFSVGTKMAYGASMVTDGDVGYYAIPLCEYF